ncbi:hypothetical protein DPMN_004302 [Dreissena polymorpha]|uniref:Uncharacterized protein n=1 Tax=Dreissena polymorpha TaxID=45954 RepID=A0A9D4MQ04_DREPO|nr:hypothetical protein DPMN_004302 [Dreissena polymorpha]
MIAILIIYTLHLLPKPGAKQRTEEPPYQSDLPDVMKDSRGNVFIDYHDVRFSYDNIAKFISEYEDDFRTFTNYQNSSKYLIYNCDKRCGGLGDRLKGIVSVYILSQLSKRKFGIRMSDPKDLQMFLQPNVIDWRITADEIKGKEHLYIDFKELHQQFAIEMENDDIDPANSIARVKPVDIIFVKANQNWFSTYRKLSVSPDRFPIIYKLPTSDITRIIYHGLFKPSDELQNLVDDFFAKKVKDKHLVCLHARMGEKGFERYSFDDIKLALYFLKHYDRLGGHVIMLATDNKQVKDYAKKTYTSLVDTEFSDDFSHVDHLGSGSVDDRTKEHGFMHAVLDHTILSRCSTLVLTNSGFGVTASAIRHTSDNLFTFPSRSKSVIRTRREVVREIFQWRCFSHLETGYVCDG